MTDKKLYTTDSIESLSPLAFTRLRPGCYAGDTTYSTQLLVEIVSNAIDEFRLGHGSQIDVTIDKDVISVRDYGQGFIPNSFRDDGKTILEAAFSVLNTSGKYREDGTYEGTSLGSFGIGSKITTYLSHWLDVATCRDGQIEFIHFKEGEFHTRTKSALGAFPDTKQSGTFVKWQPSEDFFTNPEVDIKAVKSLFKTITCLCPGLTINLTCNGENTKYYSEKGLVDLVNDGVKDKEILDRRFIMKFEQDKYKMDLVLTYTSNYNLTLIPYVNTGLTESGPHIAMIKTTITRTFNNFIREKKWLKDDEENLSGEDFQEGMYLVFNITAPGVSYDAQVKSRVVKVNMAPFTSALSEQLNVWLGANAKDVKIIVDKALLARKAREKAKKAKEAVRASEEKKTKALKFDSKLADCYGKDRSKCEIYITEGDSASGNLKTARNNEFQAVMPVRGKILNCQKAPLDKIQKNAEIMTMIEAFGLTVDTKNMKITYRPEDLRYGKIIIMSDADVDGSHIKNLFYTFIWNFCPELIQDGYIYAGVPPLYKVTIGKKYKYIKNDEELEKFRAEHQGEKYLVNRMKGLGEMDVDETEETLTDPEQRIIKQITIDDVKAADKLFEDLMGTAITPRKKFIQEHSAEAMGQI